MYANAKCGCLDRRAVSGVGYGSVRFLTEFARQPDDFLGFLAFGMSMGQWLSLPMVITGVVLFWYFNRVEVASTTSTPSARR